MRIDGILLPLYPLPHHHPIPLLLTVFAFFFLRFLYVRVDIPLNVVFVLFFCWAFFGVGDLGMGGVEKQEVDKKGEIEASVVLAVYDQVVSVLSDEEKDRGT